MSEEKMSEELRNDQGEDGMPRQTDLPKEPKIIIVLVLDNNQCVLLRCSSEYYTAAWNAILGAMAANMTIGVPGNVSWQNLGDAELTYQGDKIIVLNAGRLVGIQGVYYEGLPGSPGVSFV